jgi:hypothetical protein
VPQLFVALQVTSQLHEPLQSTPPLQASSAVQSAEQLPGPHTIVVAQAFDAHCTSHADDIEQFTPLLHAPEPHTTLHGPEPHRMGEAHVSAGHVMSQLDAWVQSSVLRHCPVTQTILQGMPAGQTTGLLHDV